MLKSVEEEEEGVPVNVMQWRQRVKYQTVSHNHHTIQKQYFFLPHRFSNGSAAFFMCYEVKKETKNKKKTYAKKKKNITRTQVLSLVWDRLCIIIIDALAGDDDEAGISWKKEREKPKKKKRMVWVIIWIQSLKTVINAPSLSPDEKEIEKENNHARESKITGKK